MAPEPEQRKQDPLVTDEEPDQGLPDEPPQQEEGASVDNPLYSPEYTPVIDYVITPPQDR